MFRRKFLTEKVGYGAECAFILAHKQSAMHALAVLSRVMLINCACAVLWIISMPVFVTVRGLSKSSPTPSHLFVIFIVLSITIGPQAPSILKNPFMWSKLHIGCCGLPFMRSKPGCCGLPGFCIWSAELQYSGPHIQQNNPSLDAYLVKAIIVNT